MKDCEHTTTRALVDCRRIVTLHHSLAAFEGAQDDPDGPSALLVTTSLLLFYQMSAVEATPSVDPGLGRAGLGGSEGSLERQVVEELSETR